MESREIKEIRGTKCLKTRKIWEEVFWEDSKKFTDYYFEEKAEDNIGYIIGEKEIRAMMFRTPYEAVVYGKKCFLSYIVGVATKEQFRHQGLMTALLKESFGKMYHEKEPFTFLMPANPAIYEPFDFTYVYSKDIWGLKKGYDFTCLEDLWYNNELCAAERADEKKRHLISLKNLVGDNFENKIFDRIANFANSLLEKKYEIYLVRDKKYYQRQLKELIAQNGDIFLSMRKGEIEGIFLYAREGEIAIQEVLQKEEEVFSFLQKEEKKKDIIMARIIHLEEMIRLIRCHERKEFIIEVRDPLLSCNDGIFQVILTPAGGSLKKLSPLEIYESDLIHKKDVSDSHIIGKRESFGKVISIKELTAGLLKNMFINEIV